MYIGEKETKWLFVVLITSQVFVSGINIFMGMGGILGAFSAFICTLLMLLYFYVTDKIKKSHDIGFFDMLEESCGKKASITAGTILTLLSVFNCSVKLKTFSVAVTDIILPDSPVSFAMLLFAFSILAVLFFGLEALTRYALPAGIVITVFAAAVGVFNFESYKTSNIFPLFGNGQIAPKSIAGGINMFADVFYVYIIAHYFRKKHAVKRVSLNAIAISGIIITAVVFLFNLAIPYPASGNFNYPFFRFSSLANTSVLFQRLDALVYVIWLFSGFLTTGALVLFTSLIFTQSFGISDYKGVVHTVVFAVLALSFSNKNYVVMQSVFAAVALLLLLFTVTLYRLKIIMGRNSDEA